MDRRDFLKTAAILPIALNIGGGSMLSKIPLNLDKVKKEGIDKEILRAGIIAELDAINLYEQMAAMTTNENIRKILLDIAKEEKTHVGEFHALLLKEDKEQEKEMEEGKKEVKEITGK
ncbi:MAG: twin-arginine translocation signal domain-containing protein [Nitrospiraceae bacterium]|nr:twin-arginine translocation signal domain-containing protein [Nitrospiraceae bacterium]